MVLELYRARPLVVANHGKTDLGVHDCIRLALENSLDLQTAIWDEQVKGQVALASRMRMYPRLEAGFLLSQRDRPLFSRSDVIDNEGAYEVVGPGPLTGVTNFSTGRERFQRTWQAQALWSPMDAMMARYLSVVRHNEVGYSGYQRVRVAQQLIGTVAGAFYRLLALSEALPKAEALESHRRSIVRDLGSLSKRQLVSSEEFLTAQSQLAEAQNQTAEVRLNIGRQKELLAVAMNICPDSIFKVMGQMMPLPEFFLEPCKLEAAALMNRPEAYQADLTHVSSIADQKRLLVKFFPRVEGFIGYFRDENKFLLNKNWIDGGMRITWDLMDFTANMLEHGAAKSRVAKTDRERAVISLGIISQVRLKTLEAMRALERFRKNSELRTQAKEALRVAREVEEAKDKRALPRVMRIATEKASCNLLQMEIDQLVALGEVHAAAADVEAAVGTNYPVTNVNMPHVPLGHPPAVARPVGVIKRAASFVGGFLPH
ncbi:MAG: TolC family protein [Desulfomonile tiedjei]|nr:TolC family protein [Desulfomonile tiedjei]